MLDALRTQEAALFRAWLDDLAAKAEAAEAARLATEQEDAVAGPDLPAGHVKGGAHGSFGGFLLPGEGDRYDLSCIGPLLLLLWLSTWCFS